ncbi:MAG: hypothetical protein ACSLFR_00580 [Solirubrobacteraceae bacterium]
MVPKCGPGAAWGAVTGTEGSPDQLGQVSGGLVLFAYAVIFLVAGIGLLQRRDAAANSS